MDLMIFAAAADRTQKSFSFKRIRVSFFVGLWFGGVS